MRKILGIAFAMVMVVFLAACSGNTSTSAPTEVSPAAETTKGEDAGQTQTEVAVGKKVGVAMPTKDLQRWVQDGENMKKELEAAGFTVDLQYANNDIATQVSQIENMISAGCNVLVIASIDGTALGTALQGAKDANIPVVAYDRLIMQSDAVTCYATFDNQLVGTIQGQYIEEALDLKHAAGPFNIELFTGSADDNNCVFFFGGAMSVLKPYIDSGKLVVKSGSTTLAECATQNWSTEEAQKRMENIISAYYSDGSKLDAVLSSNDSVANGITNAILSSYDGDFPILTGQDCDITSVKNIVAGKQSMSIFKDTRTLASQVVQMVTAILQDQEIPVNDTSTYDNGSGIIPSYLCEPKFADLDNYQELLIESGYYREDQVK